MFKAAVVIGVKHGPSDAGHPPSTSKSSLGIAAHVRRSAFHVAVAIAPSLSVTVSVKALLAFPTSPTPEQVAVPDTTEQDPDAAVG